MQGEEGAAPDAGQTQDTFALPSVASPVGGGAIRGIDETVTVDAATGTARLRIPIPASPARGAATPRLALSYDSGRGNGLFGLGWSLDVPSVQRRTRNGLPTYRDDDDVFVLFGHDDLVPVRKEIVRAVRGRRYRVRRYRPRVEGRFVRIERWSDTDDPRSVSWRTIAGDNVTTWFGRTAASRISDPADPTRIFAWLSSETWDDRGNVIAYEYDAESEEGVDAAAIHERNRTDLVRGANRYLKRVRYGNRAPFFPGAEPFADPPDDWMFQIVLDYGEHDLERPSATDAGARVVRMDPFSDRRARFDRRTYRRCRRILVFHHFPDEPNVGGDCLVRALELTYADERTPPLADGPSYSQLVSVTQAGFRRRPDGAYLRRALPPVELGYSQPTLGAGSHRVETDHLERPYRRSARRRAQFVDLDGEGLPGLLSEDAGTWIYRPNVSAETRAVVNGRPEFSPHFEAPRAERVHPAGGLGRGRRLTDLFGDGRSDVVAYGPKVAGFHRRTEDGGYAPYRAFRSLPRRDFDDPNLRMIDLTGDGRPDLVITSQDGLTWHASLGERGFTEARRVRHALDEEASPRVVFADAAQSIFVADFSGDGLMDIVRIRAADVCYWPNLGYGYFGPKVTVSGAPRFGEGFDPRRVRLADVDGSGTADVLYVGPREARVWFNRSGDALSLPRRVPGFAGCNDLEEVHTVDLLGDGTSCLVWTSAGTDGAPGVTRYVRLMADGKPHLLVWVANNLGMEKRLRYAPSTTFYLRDRRAGRPWRTRLPFPVQVVERVETFDRVSRNRFVARYAYHHGYFDGVEREFRGFGSVEQWDTEQIGALTEDGVLPPADNEAPASHVPPVRTQSWFHTGHLDSVAAFAAEYFPDDDDLPVAPAGAIDRSWSGRDVREAGRALKGALLRQEVYGEDGSASAAVPYAVSEHRHLVTRLAPSGEGHGVFSSVRRESVQRTYDRVPDDPRISHELNLELDAFGNVLKSARAVYGRRTPDPGLSAGDRARQAESHVVFEDRRFTDVVEDPDDYRTPVLCEARKFELTGYVATGSLRPSDLFDGTDALFEDEIPFEGTPSGGRQRRLFEHVRTFFRPDDLGAASGDASALLSLGRTGRRALPGSSYRLALTPGLVASYRRDSAALVPDPATVFGDRTRGGYTSSESLRVAGVFPAGPGEPQWTAADADGHWWVPSGRMFFSGTATDTPAQEFAHAAAHFFLPRRWVDPHGNTAHVDYDAYDLLPLGTHDALGNRVTAGERDPSGALVRAGLDYRVLQPSLRMDENRNLTELAFDALGRVVGTAVRGKPEEAEGDRLDGFEPDLDEAVIVGQLADPRAAPHAALGRATTRWLIDEGEYLRSRADPNPRPARVGSIQREVHDADLAPGEVSPVRLGVAYSDGFGRAIQSKLQAEGGRWVGSGWTVSDNKGRTVRRYEPFFSPTHAFELNVRNGVSPVVFYDPVGRVVGTLFPDHTYERTKHHPWHTVTWDRNDNAAADELSADPILGAYFTQLPTDDTTPAWRTPRIAGDLGPAAARAAAQVDVHAGTPRRRYANALGRPFLTVDHARRLDAAGAPVDTMIETRTRLDVQGNLLEMVDGELRTASENRYDMLSRRIWDRALDSKERFTAMDVGGRPLSTWNARGQDLEFTYDALRRPREIWLARPDGTRWLVERTDYGEGETAPETNNLRGRMVRVFDQAGRSDVIAYDFKGNATREQRRFADVYRETLSWAEPVALSDERFLSLARHDALSRPVQQVAPHAVGSDERRTVVQPRYNEAGLLEAVQVWFVRTDAPRALLDPATADHTVIEAIDYNARGQRTRVLRGNGVETTFDHDPATFRVARRVTRRPRPEFADDCPEPRRPGWPGCELESLHYTYDPVGNVASIRDDAQQALHFRNRRVEPSTEYVYDATYRLIEATGREHLGQTASGPAAPSPFGAFDAGRADLVHPSDGAALGTYIERYSYDRVGNLSSLVHAGSDPAHPGWRRDYDYAPGTNLLASTDGAPYAYDARGNLTAAPHLLSLTWDHLDRLQSTARQVVGGGRTPKTTWYRYDRAGRRVRKVTDRQANAGAAPSRASERLYFAGFEFHREYAGDGVTITLGRETLHVRDGVERAGLIESRVRGADAGPAVQIRHQFADHLGSSSIELDDDARILSYEVYTPFGSTAYQGVQTEVPKRYRFSGMERDVESGLAYHGARYYAPWLGRWCSPDPAGLVDGHCPYAYARNNPIARTDPGGKCSTGRTEERPARTVGPGTGDDEPSEPPPPPPTRIAGTGEPGDEAEGLAPGISEGEAFAAQWLGYWILGRHPLLAEGGVGAGHSSGGWRAAFGPSQGWLRLAGAPGSTGFDALLTPDQLGRRHGFTDLLAHADDPIPMWGTARPSISVERVGDETRTRVDVGGMSFGPAVAVPGGIFAADIAVRGPSLIFRPGGAGAASASTDVVPFIGVRFSLGGDLAATADSAEVTVGVHVPVVSDPIASGGAFRTDLTVGLSVQPARGVAYVSTGLELAVGVPEVELATDVTIRLGVINVPDNFRLHLGGGGGHNPEVYWPEVNALPDPPAASR